MPNTCDSVSRLKKLEQAMDRQFSFLGIKFGFDGLIGLIPVAGDIVTAGFGLYLIIEARRLGASRWTMAKMLVNWAIDAGVGAIPVVGDFFDIAFKSNTKNIRMLITDLEQRAERLRAVNREALRAAAA